MSELLPSRDDENFRYTQIAMPGGDWATERLANTQKAAAAFKPWTKDFYLPMFEGVEVARVSAPKTGEWILLKSSGESEKIRGSLELIVPRGKAYKVFEVLENSSERSLLVRNIRVEEGATLDYFVYQNQSLSNTLVLRHFVDVAPTAKVNFRFFHRGGKKCQHRIAARVAKNAEFIVEGATRLHNAQHVDIWAESQHEGPVSHSNTSVWNVLNDQAVAVFNGMIRIIPNCPQTQAYQSNKTLLLSEKARVYTLPKLEIATDDVKCSHGASVSSLDADQLFYLRSRGITPDQAKQMLVDAFTTPVLQYIPKHLLSEQERAVLGLKEDDLHGF